MEFLRDSKLYSIFTGTCPVCHQGKMYCKSNPYNLGKIFKMHETCSNCEQKFKIEPSFFFGAMYVSYGLGVAIAIALFIIAYYFIDLDRLTAFFSIIGALVVLYPVIVRVSRNIWINFFLDYKPEKDPAINKNA